MQQKFNLNNKTICIIVTSNSNEYTKFFELIRKYQMM